MHACAAAPSGQSILAVSCMASTVPAAMRPMHTSSAPILVMALHAELLSSSSLSVTLKAGDEASRASSASASGHGAAIAAGRAGRRKLPARGDRDSHPARKINVRRRCIFLFNSCCAVCTGKQYHSVHVTLGRSPRVSRISSGIGIL